MVTLLYHKQLDTTTSKMAGTSIWTQLSEFFHHHCGYTDPRLYDWLFVDSLVGPAIIIALYFLFICCGSKWMEKKRPFELHNVLVVYNFSMVLFSLYIIHEFIAGGWFNGYSFGCQEVDSYNSPKALRMAGAIWMFYIAKFIELLDTVFFILRKKGNQVTFLHVFHHGCLPLFWWWGVKTVPGGFGTFHALVNCCVHVVMYFYYGVAALGPRYRKYIWWKRYVTLFQLAQFFIVSVHNSQLLFIECAYPWKFAAFIQGFTTIVALLFLNFYIKTYLHGNKDVKDKSAQRNGYSQSPFFNNNNGLDNRIAANGHKNGHVLNGNTPPYNLRRREL